MRLSYPCTGPRRMMSGMIVDSAIYVDGARSESLGGDTLTRGTYESCRSRGGMVWVGLLDPTREELEGVAEEFGLSREAVVGLSAAHRRPGTERYGDLTFVALLTASYREESETVVFGEIQVLTGPDFVISARHGGPSELSRVRRDLEGNPGVIQRGSEAVLRAVMGRVVDDYVPVVEGLEDDIDEIETEVFGGSPRVSQRIYELSREVIRFERATGPLADVLARLAEDAPEDDTASRNRLREIRGRLLRVTEQTAGFRSLLSNILNVNLTLVSVQQADQTKRISAWAAILVVPTLITGVYGMNFRYMPEISWPLGYPLTLGAMGLICLVLYLLFRRSGWL